MAKTADIARDLLGSLVTDGTMPIAVRWIDNRYKELVSRVRFRHLRKVGEVYLPAAVTTGTVAVTRGSTAVVGTTTTWITAPGIFATTVAPYWFIRSSVAWYEIDAVVNDTSLTLRTAYAEDTNATASYTIVKRYHPLATDARWLGIFVHSRLGTNLGYPVSADELDYAHPRRTHIASPITMVAQKGVNASGALLIEAYPYPSTSEMLHYVYWALPSTLDIDTTIPAQVDGYVLKEGAYIDYCRYMMSLREKENKIEAAAFWRNEWRAQETAWENRIREASRTDRGVDDLTFILRTIHSSGPMVSDIRTARDHWLATYTFPG